MLDVVPVQKPGSMRFVLLRYRNADLRRVAGFSLHDSYGDAEVARERWMANGGHEAGVSYSVVTMTGFHPSRNPVEVVAMNLLRMTLPVRTQR